MAVRAGRTMVMKLATVVIGGVRTTGIKFNATPIDITNNDHSGLQTLLSGAAGKKMLTISVAGVETDGLLRAKWVAPGTDLLLTDVSLVDSGAPAPSDTLTGDFYLTDYEITGGTEYATQFSATLTSSGPWAFA